MVFVYLDALGDDFLQLKNLEGSSLRARLSLPPVQALWTLNADQWCDLLGVQTRNTADNRVAGVVRAIDQDPLAFTHLADAAARVGLSPSRLQSLFRQSVGMPFRRYRVWRRMAVVLRVVSGGGTLTTAAFEAGFSSSAHLSSTFRAMFGLTLSSLISLGSSIEFS